MGNCLQAPARIQFLEKELERQRTEFERFSEGLAVVQDGRAIALLKASGRAFCSRGIRKGNRRCSNAPKQLSQNPSARKRNQATEGGPLGESIRE